MKSSEKFSFRCPDCESTLRVPTSYADRKGRCPKCGHVIQVPTLAQSTTSGARRRLHGKGDDNHFEIHCPHCCHKTRLQKSLVGKNVECPSCEETYIASKPVRSLWPGYSGDCVLVKVAASLWDRSLELTVALMGMITLKPTDFPDHFVTLRSDRYVFTGFRGGVRAGSRTKFRVTHYFEVAKREIESIRRTSFTKKNPTYLITLLDGTSFRIQVTRKMQQFGNPKLIKHKWAGSLSEHFKPGRTDSFTAGAMSIRTSDDIMADFLEQLELNAD